MSFFDRFRRKTISLDTLIRRLEAVYATASGVDVTPETCMQSPTVQAVVNAIASFISICPVHVLQRGTKYGRATKERLPNHPVERLLAKPNEWQSSNDYWLDATSRLLRYGNHFAFKARGVTGPIRRLISLDPSAMTVEQQDDWSLVYRAKLRGGDIREFDAGQVHHARRSARNGYLGDSPIMDVRESIALEIAAERMGGSVFGNGAMPGMVLGYKEGFAGFKTDEEKNNFVNDLQEKYARRGRFKALLLPRGIEVGQQIPVENEKAQFLQTRQHQRTVIAGALGVPPHMVGDLQGSIRNNVEHQSLEFTQRVVLPVARIFETAMERDLLTDADRASGVIIRFNLEGALRGDFTSRQEGLKIQREAGVINPNDWREHEGMNPIPPEQGGEDFWRQGPSGQSGRAGDEPASGGRGESEENDDDPNA